MIKRLAVFVFVNASFAFVALAGGIEWGTFSCGIIALVSLMASGVLVAIPNRKH
jgi:hypothetical protein